MEGKFYKQRQNKWFCGVLAGLADKFHWDATILRVLFVFFLIMTHGGAILYLLLALFLPYKEDLIREEQLRHYHERQRKEAEPVSDHKFFF